MSRLPVLFAAHYLTHTCSSPDEWRANRMVRFLKDEPWNGYTVVAGRRVECGRGDAEVFIPYIGELLGNMLRVFVREDHEGVALVPMPSSGLVVGSERRDDDRLAQALAWLMRVDDGVAFPGLEVLDVLRWRENKGSLRDGAERDPWMRFENLWVPPGAVQGRDVVLVDDVATTGGTLRAAERRLRLAGANVLGALAAARTVARDDAELWDGRDAFDTPVTALPLLERMPEGATGWRAMAWRMANTGWLDEKGEGVE